MNAQSKVRAIPSGRAGAPSERSPQAVSGKAAIPIAVDPRDMRLDAELRAIRYQGMAKRAAWALQGACNALEREGVDATYWRTLAADIARRAA